MLLSAGAPGFCLIAWVDLLPRISKSGATSMVRRRVHMPRMVPGIAAVVLIALCSVFSWASPQNDSLPQASVDTAVEGTSNATLGADGTSNAARVDVASEIAAVTDDVLCALLHLEVPAQYWESANSFVVLKKTLEALTNAQRAVADHQVRELVRAKQLDSLKMRRGGNVFADEFEAITRHEIILTLRRRELDKLTRQFAKVRDPSRYLMARSQLIKDELAALSEKVAAMRMAIDARPPRELPSVATDEDTESQGDVKEKATAAGGGNSREHRLNNVVEIDSDEMYRLKARDLRRRIEQSTKPSERQALRGELATLFQKHSPVTRRSGGAAGSVPRKGVYRTMDGETPAQVATLLGIDVNKLLVENHAHRPDLLPSTLLERGSPLVIPRVLVHHAQQRLQEAAAVGEARQEVNKARNLHTELQRAVEQQDYDRAAQLAARLHESGGDAADAGAAADAGRGARSGAGPDANGRAATAKGKAAIPSAAAVPADTVAGAPAHHTEDDEQEVDEAKRGRADSATPAKRAKGAAKADSSGRARGSRAAATSDPDKGVAAAKPMTMLVSCAACGAAIRVENVSQDFTIAQLLLLAVEQGLPAGYDSFMCVYMWNEQVADERLVRERMCACTFFCAVWVCGCGGGRLASSVRAGVACVRAVGCYN